VTSERSVERRFFTYENDESFCTELTNGGTEVLCDWVGEGVMPDKADMCFRACTPSQKGIPPDTPKPWLKSLQKGRLYRFWCGCCVKSTDKVREWKKITCIKNYIIFYLTSYTP
jgi:hypothetical protein